MTLKNSLTSASEDNKMNEIVNHTRPSKLYFAVKVYVISMLIIQIVIAALFIGGVTHFYGKPVNISNSINLCLSVFNMGKAYYRGILGTGLGVLYIIVLIELIKNIFSTSSWMKQALYERYNHAKQEKAIMKITSNIGGNLVAILTITLVSAWIKPTSTTESLNIIVISSVLCLLMGRAFIYILRGEPLAKMGISLGYTTIFGIALAIAFAHAKLPIIESIIDDFSSIGLSIEEDTMFLAFILLAEHITYLIMSIAIIRMLANASDFVDINVFSNRAKAKSLLYMVIALQVCVIAYNIAGGGVKVDVETIIEFIKPYLSLICVVVAMLVTTNLEIPSIKAKKKEEPTNTESRPQPAPAAASTSAHAAPKTAPVTKNRTVAGLNNGILRINDIKTAITDFEYQEQRDIKIVVIPGNIERVGKGAFDGCGGITAIYCEANGRPADWNPEWLFGCQATVHWGVSATLIDDLIKALRG